MTLNVLLALIALAVVLACLKWRRCSRVLLGLALIVLLAVGCGPVPRWLLARLQSGHATTAAIDWGQRNVIVLLGAGTVRVAGSGEVEPSLFAYGRIGKAAQLYRTCRQAGRECKVELSGGDARGLGRPEAAVYAGELQRLGVDTADLLLESRSMNTWQNAQFSGPLLKAYGADRVLLVSSGFHLRRAMLYFMHFGIHAVLVPADHVDGVLSWLPLSYNFAMADLALHEYAGIVRYHVYNAMGWNVTATKPGAL
ncbi:YdcF family protein [Rhodanobacter sp. B2A1Ga4]|uniref:YdcF family protein n=1 Tax=Rhodanobacter sp. B2A1Ga4 TaxID=2778647 RepID=UPI001B37699E|nr:YdcF family protein [Rhodanobacter sp. B2A1Ga4]MBQ4853807.1 YdcF family protein [Rhodanobacter sp. B2A1Ga4]